MFVICAKRVYSHSPGKHFILFVYSRQKNEFRKGKSTEQIFLFELSFPFSFISYLFQFAFHVQQTRQHIKLQKGIKENLFNFFTFFIFLLSLSSILSPTKHQKQIRITNSKPITKENRKFEEENICSFCPSIGS